MNSKDYKYCKSCAYCSSRGGAGLATCDYMDATGHARSLICHYGVGCKCHSKFDPNAPKRRKHGLAINRCAASLGIGRKDYIKIDRRVAMELYRDGKNDREIARYFKCTPGAVLLWRRAYRLPSKFDRHAKRKKTP